MISQVLRVVCYIVCGESVEMIKEFFYLVSTISYGDEIKIHFGCLKKSIFTNSYLSIAVKRAVYKAVALTTPLYSYECRQSRLIKYTSWKCSIIGVYGSFFGVSSHQQWTVNVSNHKSVAFC